ncbi:RapZ C-terminal domain-containing protein [Nonomuraea longicatena]|uniref:RapZ C-terminal domain-containing protein n=1 Tax=Nonomuraea longicatena TaxID=83682 RepID=UPI0031CDB5FD
MADFPSSRRGALHALAHWARHHRRSRSRLISAAWRAGEHNIAALARTADVSRDTVYSDLAEEGLDYSDRSAPGTTVRPSRRQVELTTYGVLHRDPPHGTVALSVNLASALRDPLDDPEVRDRMRSLDGRDAHVRAYVLGTPGALEIVGRMADQLRALVDGWGNAAGHLVRAHVSGRHGRHRSVAVAQEIAAWLHSAGYGVAVEHREITKGREYKSIPEDDDFT